MSFLSFTINLMLFICSFVLFKLERGRDRDLPPAGYSCRWPQRAVLNQVESRSQEVIQAFHVGGKGRSTWATLYSFPHAINRKLDWKMEQPGHGCCKHQFYPLFHNDISSHTHTPFKSPASVNGLMRSPTLTTNCTWHGTDPEKHFTKVEDWLTSLITAQEHLE